MLTFLRKIRKSMIESGSAAKYALYAIGEIALVVIGILIALQINNWNQSNHNANLEKDFVTNIKSDLNQDKANMEDVISQVKVKLEIFELMLEEMPELYNNHPSRLDTLFISAFDPISTFFPIDGAIKSESASGNMGKFKDKNYISALYKHYTLYERILGNGQDLDNTWTLRYEKYRNVRRTGKLGKLSKSDISNIQDDLSRCSRHLNFYLTQCHITQKEIDSLLKLK